MSNTLLSRQFADYLIDGDGVTALADLAVREMAGKFSSPKPKHKPPQPMTQPLIDFPNCKRVADHEKTAAIVVRELKAALGLDAYWRLEPGTGIVVVVAQHKGYRTPHGYWVETPEVKFNASQLSDTLYRLWNASGRGRPVPFWAHLAAVQIV